MALKIAITESSVGIGFPEAYARITNIFANKDQLQYQVAVWANQDARNAEAQSVAQHAYYMATPKGEDWFPAIYADLKLQAGFETAEDV